MCAVIAQWLNTFPVYAFTLISGYLFCYIKYEKKGYSRYVPFLIQKAKRLLVPYVFIALIWAAPVHAWFYGPSDLFEKYVLGTAPSQLWFLLMLFWVFAIFWPISDLAARKPVDGALTVCALYCLGRVLPNIYCISTGFRYVLFFWLGFVIRRNADLNRFLYKIPSALYISVHIMLFCVISFLETDTLFLRAVGMGLTELLYCIGAVGAFVVLQRLLSRFSNVRRIVNVFAPYSMTIYLFHQQIVYFSIQKFSDLQTIFLILLNFIISLTGAALIAVLASKTSATRFLAGCK